MTTDDSAKTRSKHLLIKICFVKDYVLKGVVKVIYLSTAEMTADILTKPKQGEVFYYHVTNMMGLKYEVVFNS